ncbi:MAG: PQQ-dependent sugar dehydrogenase [Aridibacter famidurans]|nr:PQQ-dependent sugar dehydrogenase [Aridibacter famidurans]
MKAVLGFVLGAVLFSAAAFSQGSLNIKRQAFLSGLSSPLFLTHAKDGSNRVFVVQQRGIIKVVQPVSYAVSDFINLSSKVSQSGSERGLLGLAFHPDFATNSYFFVNYTRQSDGATVVERYKAINNNSVGDPNSGRIVIVISQDFSNHNGGMIEFGPDGNLYIGMGDGGSAFDPNNRAQDINSLLGKMLRITVDVSGNDANPPYTNPADNPYVGQPGADEIYAIGLRNPFRWSFDRGGTNELWAGDVGQGSIEEVDIVTNGGNYGWRVYEGNSCTNQDPGLCDPDDFDAPIHTYTHSAGRCSITGGYRYRGRLRTFGDGEYLYGDYCSGEFWRFVAPGIFELVENTTRNISSFGEDQNGELYLVGLGGTVEKLVRITASADFDGDARTDLSVFRPSNGVWYIDQSGSGQPRFEQFGISTDIPVAEDFDGDDKSDIAVYRPSSGTWYVFRSSDSTFQAVQFGVSTDIPSAGDFDGDAKAEFVVFRPSNGIWYKMDSTTLAFSAVQFGVSTDLPIPADYDGDGTYDISVYRPSNGVWYRLNSSNGSFSAVQFGISTDKPVRGDYDGDGRDDIAVYRPSEGIWYIYRSGTGTVRYEFWGISTDIPVTGDYDGDGRDDVAVWRESNGTWYIQRSAAGPVFAQFGANGDLPIPAYDSP